MSFHTQIESLEARAPFDFEKSLAFLGGFMPNHAEQTIADNTMTKAVMVEGQPLIFRVKAAHSPKSPTLEYTLFSEEPITAARQAAAADRISFFLSLDDDLQPFYAIGQDDPYFAPVLEKLYGYHQVKFMTPFENACWAVLTQRNPMNLAGRMKQALMDKFGTRLELDGVTYPVFPEASQIAQADPEEVPTTIHHERKGEQIAAVARAFSQVDEDFLRTGPYDEVEAWLRSIKGIGAWSANFVMLRGLGRMERIPTEEKRLNEVVSKQYSESLEQIAGRYGPHQGYWAHYMRVGG